jgi:hypothetical protein
MVEVTRSASHVEEALGDRGGYRDREVKGLLAEQEGPFAAYESRFADGESLPLRDVRSFCPARGWPDDGQAHVGIPSIDADAGSGRIRPVS